VGALLSGLGDVYRAQGRHADAEPLLKRGLAVVEKARGLDDIAVFAPLLHLAQLYIDQRRYADAVRLHERGLAILEGMLGPEHPNIAPSLALLTELHRAQGHEADAEPLLKRSLAIAEKAHGADHPDVGRLLAELGLLYLGQGRHADGEPLVKRSLAIAEKAHGRDHPEVAKLLTELGLRYLAQGQFTDAAPLLERSRAIAERALGSGDLDLARPLGAVGWLYQFQGRYTDAEPLVKRSLAIVEKVRGPTHPDTGAALNSLGLLYVVQGRYAEAEPLLKRSLAIAEKARGRDHQDAGLLLHGLAELYRSQGRPKEAEPLYRRSLAILQARLTPDHPIVLLTTGSLGTFLKSEGRLDEAEPFLKRALEGALRHLVPQHPQVVSATVHLAELYGLQGRVPEARELFAKAGASDAVDLKTFPVYFGTNRKRDPKQKRIAFGSERNLSELTLGTVKVVVPPPRRSSTGKGAGGKAEALELGVSDVRQLVIQPVELATGEQLVRAARDRLFGARAYLGQALVFVHGYNTSFDNAVRRAGQLAYDLGYDGPVFAFSWPTRDSLWSYLGARESAQLSADGLREFLERVVAETKAKRIHVVAHSMGNVALNEALFTLEPETLAKLNFGELVLASPDLDPDLFLRTYKRLQKRGATTTIYAASSDWALWLSSGLRGRPQLGYIPRGGPRRLVSGTDLIDISSVNSDVFSLNHDTYANSPAVIADLKRLLKDGQRPPEARTTELVKVPAAGGVYWRYKAPGSKQTPEAR
jgi:esterase/lipase superfamily enzyme/Tfp pilus assembly protein PilF